MPNPLPERIINRIDKLVRGTSLPRELRDQQLGETAQEAWRLLFPEDTQDHCLPPDARMQRWNEVRDQLSANPIREKILRVLESPANGEPFYWLG
jgi:hypothetical protein